MRFSIFCIVNVLVNGQWTFDLPIYERCLTECVNLNSPPQVCIIQTQFEFCTTPRIDDETTKAETTLMSMKARMSKADIQADILRQECLTECHFNIPPQVCIVQTQFELCTTPTTTGVND